MVDPDHHDGIVLDEVDFTFLDREDLIALTDEDDDAYLHVRYGGKSLPPARKIFISNHAPKLLYNSNSAGLYPYDDTGAIARRVTVFHINERAYHTPVQAMVVQRPNGAAFATQP